MTNLTSLIGLGFEKVLQKLKYWNFKCEQNGRHFLSDSIGFTTLRLLRAKYCDSERCEL